MMMNKFCGDVHNAWGPMSRGYLTHCFDDLLIFGITYVFIFTAGSFRVWSLLPVRTVPEFPYSTRHSAKVLVLGWLGLFPMILFSLRYARGVHDDFEWVAKPLASLAWLFSLWIQNMEVARDLPEGWVLKTFYASSVVAATISLPTVVISSEVSGYGVTFWAYMIHYIMYLVIAILAFRCEHKPRAQTDEGFAVKFKSIVSATGIFNEPFLNISLSLPHPFHFPPLTCSRATAAQLSNLKQAMFYLMCGVRFPCVKWMA